MDKNQLKGDFSTTPFPQVLFHIWRTEKTGTLTIKGGKSQEKIPFKKGNIVGELASFPEGPFLQSLVEKEIIDSHALEEGKGDEAGKNSSAITALIERGLISPSRLWQFMEDFFKQELFSLFDLPSAEYSFKSENVAYESQLLKENQTIHLILQGIRQMRNNGSIEAHLPQEFEILETLNPTFLNKLHLEPYEKYVLALVDNTKSLKSIYEESKAGKRETQKCIYAFLMLGIVSTHPQREGKKHFAEFSPEEFEKILSAFNTKLGYIFKYISKEIGPVAYNTLSKCLDEIKPHLGPSFKELELRPDGSITVKSFLKMNISLPSDERWKNLTHGLNEILVAEVLAVKKTLGNTHESLLVENLEKMGELE